MFLYARVSHVVFQEAPLGAEWMILKCDPILWFDVPNLFRLESGVGYFAGQRVYMTNFLLQGRGSIVINKKTHKLFTSKSSPWVLELFSLQRL